MVGGRPLISHAIRRSIDSGIFRHVVVSTEDPKMAGIARREGAEVPFVRPRRLASDSASMIDIIVHGILELESLGFDLDIMVNRNCTVPFIRDADISRAIRILRRANCDMVAGAYRQYHNPYFDVVELGPKGFLRVAKGRGGASSRQAAPAVYQLAGLHAFRKDGFLRYRKEVPPRTILCEIPIETGR